MFIAVVEKDPAIKASLLAKVSDGLRQASIDSLEVKETREENFNALLWGTVSGVIIGPSYHDKVIELTEHVRQYFATGPVCVVLSAPDYERDAVSITKKLSVRAFSESDLNQLTSFLIECANHLALASGRKNRNVVGVCHFKGGVGCTTVASSLAACWARHGTKTALIDLDDVNPHLTTWARVGTARRGATAEHLELGTVPESRIPDIASPVESFGDALAVVGQPEDYNTGFHLKANVLDNAPSASEFMHSLISALKLHYQAVVIDLARSWGLATFASLPRCEHVLLVTDQDSASVRRTLECLRRLKRESDDGEEFDLSRWRLVLNASTGDGVSEDEIREQMQELDIFPGEQNIITIPYSAKGHDWGEPGTTLYDLAESKTRSVIEATAYELISFRTHSGEQPRQASKWGGWLMGRR